MFLNSFEFCRIDETVKWTLRLAAIEVRFYGISSKARVNLKKFCEKVFCLKNENLKSNPLNKYILKIHL